MMQKPGRFKLTVLFTGAALLILGSLPNLCTGQSSEEAGRLNKKFVQLYRQGRYQEAIPVAKRSLAIWEKVFGTEHPNVATGINNLALLYYSLGDYARAEPLYKRSLTIYEKALGQDHPRVALSLNNLAELYRALGDYARAEPLYKRSLAIYEKALGPDHPHVATSLNNLARLYQSLGDYARAEPLYKRSLTIREKAHGPDHPRVATSLGNLAELYRALGDYARAEPLYKRSLAIYEKALGPDHPDVATSLNNSALLYRALGDYAKAEPLLKRSLAIYEKALGPDHPSVAASLNNLAGLYRALGDFTKAEPLYKRSLAIVEKGLGPDHPNVATSLSDLALLYRALGDYAKAEPLLKRSLAIREKALGPDHPSVAASLNNLAGLYRALGDYAKAEPLLKRSLAIYEKALGPDHPHVATSLNDLALLYQSLGNYARAEPLLKRSLAIYEKALGPDHPSVAASLNNLAGLYYFLGDFTKAEPLYKRSLAINKKALGPDHPNVATSLYNLALVYLADGNIGKALNIYKKQDAPSGLGVCYLAKSNYRKAEKEFQRSLRRSQKSGRKKFIITGHIGLGLSYEGLGDFEMAKKHFNEAIDLIAAQWQTLGLSARKTFLAGKVGASFSRLDAYEGMVRAIIKEKKRGYQKEALLYAEKVKSRTLLEMLAARGARGVGKKDREVLARDRRFQQEISTLRKRLSILANLGHKAPEGEKERVEQGLNKTLQNYERFINEVKLEDTELASLITVEATPVEKIQSLLDPSTTVLEYFTTKDKTYAWLITRDHVSVHELNLGKKPLLTMVNELLLPNISNRSRRPEPLITLSTGAPHAGETGRQEREKNRQRFLKATKDFYRVISGPLENGIRTDRLIVVPHGVLHKVPFAALNDGKKFLVDKHALSVVPSSTVIEYVIKKRNRNRGRFLAFANPETEYVPLGFAELEVSGISRLFSKKEIYSRRQATEGRAKGRTNSPDIIHFACHGEFNDKQPMQSGLLLSKDADNDGYLQVHEIFGLDLGNANLVVLSACETGLSKIYGGDDLVGLSRGFIYAGTPSLLATLWEVDDQSTAILMKEFYKNWHTKGLSKPEALRQAQLTLKDMPKYWHPFHWAPFIMIGDWR